MKLYLNAYLLSLIMLCCFIQCKEEMPLPPSDADNGGIFLPDNFEAVVIIDSIGRTRHIAVSDEGDIYAQLSDPENGKATIALRDINNDGKVDSIVSFGDYIDKGRSATGVTIHNGYLYTSTRKMIYRNKLKSGELVPTSETEIVFTDMEENLRRNWHTAKPIAFDNEGYMYVPFGAPTDACQDTKLYGPLGIPNGVGLDPCPELENLAGIWRFDADKLGLTKEDGEKFSTGLRSLVGIEWNPKDESLYAVGNGIDNFHTLFPDDYTDWEAAVLPAETLMKIEKGSDYGWPYAYYDQIQGKNMLEPGYGGDGKIVGRASQYDVPILAFEGHWAPMDVMFYHGNQFPNRYNNGAFVAFHGSTDRSPYPQAGYIVCFVPFDEAGKPTGEWEVFADGFTGVDVVKNTSDAIYRPMGLSTGPDGSLYISESNHGKIWRVMYKGDKENFGVDQLAAMEKRKNEESHIKRPDEEKDLIPQGSSFSGRVLYNTYCTACHQRNGQGDNNRYPPLVGSEWVIGDEGRLIDVVLNGLQGEITVNGKTFDELMPPHKHLDDFAIASILTYVRDEFGNISEPVSTLKVTERRKVSEEKK